MDFEQILTASRKNEMQKLDEFQEGLTKKMMTLVENVETVRSGLQTQQQVGNHEVPEINQILYLYILQVFVPQHVFVSWQSCQVLHNDRCVS